MLKRFYKGDPLSAAAASPIASFYRPNWIEVDLAAIRQNLKILRRRISPRCRLLFVVKAGAYGHGAVETARGTAGRRASGLVDWLGVFFVEEGIELREVGVVKPILVMGSLYPFDSYAAAARYELRPTIASLEGAVQLAEVGRILGRRLPGHLKIETGLGRIGARGKTAQKIIDFMSRSPHLKLEGIYTHFACADTDRGATLRQLELFEEACREARGRGAVISLRHAANSAAALRHPQSRLDMIRPGLAAYGLMPHPGCAFAPALSWKAKIVFIKTASKGTTLSYGAGFRVKRPMRVATIPVGYGDGYPRLLSNKGQVLIGGRRCPVLGAVTMDMLMADVTPLPAAGVGEEVVLIGSQGAEEISVAEFSAWARSIPYETVCRLAARVPRIFLNA